MFKLSQIIRDNQTSLNTCMAKLHGDKLKRKTSIRGNKGFVAYNEEHTHVVS